MRTIPKTKQELLADARNCVAHMCPSDAVLKDYIRLCCIARSCMYTNPYVSFLFAHLSRAKALPRRISVEDTREFSVFSEVACEVFGLGVLVGGNDNLIFIDLKSKPFKEYIPKKALNSVVQEIDSALGVSISEELADKEE